MNVEKDKKCELCHAPVIVKEFKNGILYKCTKCSWQCFIPNGIIKSNN